ncbi:MAG: cobalamin-binding protein [Magnetococcus sp. YQC-9]
MWRVDHPQLPRLPRFARLFVIVWLSMMAPVAADPLPANPPATTPPQRIVALAPNLTELLFAVGAGDQLVAVADYSDHPPQAKTIPRIGGYDRFDPEAVLAARPDLVIGWPGGNPEHLLTLLQRLGLKLLLLDPRRLDEIPTALTTLGALTGHEAEAQRQANDFQVRLEGVRLRHQNAAPVGVFYQVWHQPLMTVNGTHLISDVIRACGGVNIFDDLPVLAPVIDLEAVLARDPEAIIASGMDDSRPEWLDQWRRWTPMRAVRGDQLFFVPPDLIQRHTPRILEGAQILCEHLERVRQNRTMKH